MTRARAFLAALQRPVPQRPPAPLTLLLVAHPDDEVLGAGGQLTWLAPALHVAHLTPGIPIALDPDQRATYRSAEAYGAVRLRELDSALSRIGVPAERRHRLGGKDQRCTRMLERLTCELRDLLRQTKPEVLLTHAYEGGHPDHDAAAFTAQMACGALPSAPARVEFTSYHIRDGRFECGAFLPDQDQGIRAYLGECQLSLKRALLAEFVSQRGMLTQFTPEVERFRPAIEYNFREPPHPPPLHYELYPWGIDGGTFRTLAARAVAALSANGETCRR